jgi:hypothetical protein
MYVKLFRSIFQGTLRGNSNGLLVFTNLLANCDRDGVVDVHPRAIAEEVGLDVETVRAVLVDLESPDAESRTPDEEGRRIVRMDEHRVWGWRVVNYGKYRAIKNEEDRREANRLAVAKHRAKAATPVTSSPVITGNHPSSLSAQGEGEGEGDGDGEGEEKEKKKKEPVPAGLVARGDSYRPPPPKATEIICAQPKANDAVFVSDSECDSVSESEFVKKARKRATTPERPEDVAEQVWDDWLALRKAKRAPVSKTVVEGARVESEKAGLSLETFLRIWCARGSQGLEAAWLKPHERNGASEPQWAKDRKAAVAAYGGAPRKTGQIIDMEEANATLTKLG